MKVKHCHWFAIVLLLANFFLMSQSYAAVFNMQDSDLQSCLQELADINQWHHPQDVTEVKCHSQGIRSLQGLEQFINLESLSLYNNKLEQVKIDPKSFPKLSTLNLARNNLTDLAIVDLPNLNKLYVFDNHLEVLTLSNLAKLEVFKANNNKIEQFTYSNTPQLKKIYIFNNQLETINIYDLPSLQYMDCRQNPMPDSLYDEMDKVDAITFLHDGNAEDW